MEVLHQEHHQWKRNELSGWYTRNGPSASTAQILEHISHEHNSCLVPCGCILLPSEWISLNFLCYNIGVIWEPVDRVYKVLCVFLRLFVRLGEWWGHMKIAPSGKASKAVGKRVERIFHCNKNAFFSLDWHLECLGILFTECQLAQLT